MSNEILTIERVDWYMSAQTSKVFLFAMAPMCGSKGALGRFCKQMHGDDLHAVSLGEGFRAQQDPELNAIMARRELIPDEYVWKAVNHVLQTVPSRAKIVYFDGLPRNPQQFYDLFNHSVFSSRENRLVGVLLNRSLEFCLGNLNNPDRRADGRCDDTPENVEKEHCRFKKEVLTPWYEYSRFFNRRIIVDGDQRVEKALDQFVATLTRDMVIEA